ncbi:MAG: flavodoxin family protein [Kiritimatiellia bacterium]|jgi:multimeric flavodoxin WrbA|nr:flavodoxin family protein [Kiritimatiellia bacterium]
MTIEVLGISGSPIENSNTDRLIKAVLDATELECEFVKLSLINVRPCLACKLCVPDNICKTEDDFPELAEKIKNAKALVIGAYIPYKQIDAFTKALLERFWSLRHVNNLLRGKLCATVLTYLTTEAADHVNRSLAIALEEMERMELMGQIMITGNLPCLTCGVGDECDMSGIKRRYGQDAKSSDIPYSRVEDQREMWEEATRIGREIGQRIRSTDRDDNSA